MNDFIEIYFLEYFFGWSKLYGFGWGKTAPKMLGINSSVWWLSAYIYI